MDGLNRPRPLMKLLSRRALEQLSLLQAAVQELAQPRNTALRIFMASRGATTLGAQREFWLEFSSLDQEYRVAVRRLASFCSEHHEATASEAPP